VRGSTSYRGHLDVHSITSVHVCTHWTCPGFTSFLSPHLNLVHLSISISPPRRPSINNPLLLPPDHGHNTTMTSLPPEATADLSPELIKTLYPPDLQLQYVQIFFRHGTYPLNPCQQVKASNCRRANSRTTTTTECRNTTVLESLPGSRSIESNGCSTR
jgi:hypothetical protein